MQQLCGNLLGTSTTGRVTATHGRVFAIALVMWLGLGGGAAFAATTRWVNDDDPNPPAIPPGTSCSNPGYQSIQDAVDDAAAGDTIRVCPGTYPEQLFIVGPAKNNISLLSVLPRQAVIKAPLLMIEPGDLVTIDNAQNVTLREFVVSGPLPDTLFCSLQLRSGVRVKGGGSALILGNRITEMRAATPALRGCQNGFGIAVGRQFDPLGPQVGSAVIFRNLVDRYQKGGLYVDNTGSRADIRENIIQGEGPVDYIAQNGIQVSREAVAQLRNNSVRDHVYTLPETTASGMIFFDNPRILVDRNQLNRNQDGVVLFTMTGVATVSGNTIIGAPAPFANPFGDGIFADADTARNVIRSNFLRSNAEHDCHDNSIGPNNPPALVANFWIDNNGATQNRPGLCRPDAVDDDDDDFDDDGHHNHVDDDDDNDGRPDSVDDDDDNDGSRDGDDDDDDNDNISDSVDSDSRETQRSSSGSLAGGGFDDRTITVEAGTLTLSALVEAPNADLLRVTIYNPAGVLAGVSQPVAGGALIRLPVALPGTYTVRVQNTGSDAVDFTLRLISSVPWQ